MLLELTENIYPDHRAFPEIVFSLSLIIMVFLFLFLAFSSILFCLLSFFFFLLNKSKQTIMERPAELLCAKVKLILDLEDFLKKFSVT